MNKSQDTKKWKADIHVTLTNINSYGDDLGNSVLTYSIFINGSLVDIITKLEEINK